MQPNTGNDWRAADAEHTWRRRGSWPSGPFQDPLAVCSAAKCRTSAAAHCMPTEVVRSMQNFPFAAPTVWL